jgi:U3 small nucleolar RNA-associated protein 14
VKKRKTAPNSRFLKTSAGIAPEERKDAGRSNVIITERRDKKATKHLAKDLPYPYTSVAQYEASFANPVGGEWNSRSGFQRQTLPRVTKKPGAIIEPVRKLF